MIPAPLLALIRYVIVYACGKLAAQGWTFFSFDADTTEAVVQIVAMVLAVTMTSIGVLKSRVASVIARLKARHAPALLHAANEVVGSDPGLAAAAALAVAKAVP